MARNLEIENAGRRLGQLGVSLRDGLRVQVLLNDLAEEWGVDYEEDRQKP
jgi:hypothetical protein